MKIHTPSFAIIIEWEMTGDSHSMATSIIDIMRASHAFHVPFGHKSLFENGFSAFVFI